MLSYNLFDAPRSIKAVVFLMSLIFGSYLFAWFTNQANRFFSYAIK